MEKNELNLDNPIFVVYIDGERMPKDYVNKTVEQFKKTIDIYSNAIFWYIVSDRTAIECIYDGFSRNRQKEISSLVKEINTRIEIMSDSKDFEDFKINNRDWRISEVIDG